MNKLFFLLLLLLPIRLAAQVNYDEIRNKAFYSTYIDTVNKNVLIAEMKHAIVIFKQSDLASIIKIQLACPMMLLLGIL